ncbi:MAG: divalent-cation tolerance protein CutA [Burkholderiaceae bacterium]|nr:divalent-cation tolerance protein CutA [Burkholderiaceae bacterium]
MSGASGANAGAGADAGAGAGADAVKGADAVTLVLTSLPDAKSAHALAESLVAERLAACVNVLAQCRSVYRWDGAVERADEVPVLIKTSTARVAQLIVRLEQSHPYQLPEVITVGVDGGLQRYLDWVVASTTGR